MKSISLKEQIRIYYDADVLLAAHGAALINSIFMKPYSVLVECSPPFYVSKTYIFLTAHARIHYIYVPNFDAEYLVSRNLTIPYERYNSGQRIDDLRYVVNLPITTSFISIISSLRDAMEYIAFRRNTFVNDILSPVVYFVS